MTAGRGMRSSWRRPRSSRMRRYATTPCTCICAPIGDQLHGGLKSSNRCHVRPKMHKLVCHIPACVPAQCKHINIVHLPCIPG